MIAQVFIRPPALPHVNAHWVSDVREQPAGAPGARLAARADRRDGVHATGHHEDRRASAARWRRRCGGAAGHTVRPSQVRAVLSQAALRMHLPDPRFQVPAYAAGPEYDRLKSTLKQLKADAKDSLGAVGAQLAMETEASRVVEHVNGQVRSVQRAFGVLADTLEDEVGNLRAADAQQWEQLKVHATQFHEVEDLKAELERTKAELRSNQTALATFKSDEHASLARKVDELATELAEQRETIAGLQKTHAAERNRLMEEVGSLRRWRTDVASPFIESAGRSVASHEQTLERNFPQLQKLVDDLDARTAKHIPELIEAADAGARRQQHLEEEGSRLGAQLARLGESHTESASRLEERLRLFRDESRTEAESHELRLRQAAAELEAHAEALRQLAAEGGKARWRRARRRTRWRARCARRRRATRRRRRRRRSSSRRCAPTCASSRTPPTPRRRARPDA